MPAPNETDPRVGTPPDRDVPTSCGACESLSGRATRMLVRHTEIGRAAGDAPRTGTQLAAALADAIAALADARAHLRDQHLLTAGASTDLQAARQRHLALIDGLPLPYLLTDQEGVVLRANRAATTLLNASQKILVNRRLSLFLAERRDEFLQDLAGMVASGGRRGWTLVLRPRERQRRIVTASVAVLRRQPAHPFALVWLFADAAGEPSPPPRRQPPMAST
jgi:PAS domain-containing protein